MDEAGEVGGAAVVASSEAAEMFEAAESVAGDDGVTSHPQLHEMETRIRRGRVSAALPAQ